MVGRPAFPRMRNRSSSNAAPTPTLPPASAAAAASALSSSLRTASQSSSNPQIQAPPSPSSSGTLPPGPTVPSPPLTHASRSLTSMPIPGGPIVAGSNSSASSAVTPAAGPASKVMMPKMMHSMKLSLKGTGSKKLVREDETLIQTEATLNTWLTSANQLLSALEANEQAWQGLFGTYSQFGPTVASIYPLNDSEAMECASQLTNFKGVLSNPPHCEESHFEATQRIDISKKDLANLQARIISAKKMHHERVAIIRDLKYYDEKTRLMIAAEQKKKTSATPKEVERRSRNETKCSELTSKLHSTNNQLFYEMDAIAVEHLASTDRAFFAFLQLQSFYFRAFPASRAYETGSRIGLGRRVLIRDEVRPWLPASLQGQGANGGISSSADGAMSHPTQLQMNETPVFALPAFNPNAAVAGPGSYAMSSVSSRAVTVAPIPRPGALPGQEQHNYYASPQASASAIPQQFNSQPQHIQQIQQNFYSQQQQQQQQQQQPQPQPQPQQQLVSLDQQQLATSGGMGSMSQPQLHHSLSSQPVLKPTSSLRPQQRQRQNSLLQGAMPVNTAPQRPHSTGQAHGQTIQPGSQRQQSQQEVSVGLPPPHSQMQAPPIMPAATVAHTQLPPSMYPPPVTEQTPITQASNNQSFYTIAQSNSIDNLPYPSPQTQRNDLYSPITPQVGTASQSSPPPQYQESIPSPSSPETSVGEVTQNLAAL